MRFAAAGEAAQDLAVVPSPGKSVTLTAIKDAVSDPLYRPLA
jgi:hypothetical protein